MWVCSEFWISSVLVVATCVNSNSKHICYTSMQCFVTLSFLQSSPALPYPSLLHCCHRTRDCPAQDRSVENSVLRVIEHIVALVVHLVVCVDPQTLPLSILDCIHDLRLKQMKWNWREPGTTPTSSNHKDGLNCRCRCSWFSVLTWKRMDAQCGTEWFYCSSSYMTEDSYLLQL